MKYMRLNRHEKKCFLAELEAMPAFVESAFGDLEAPDLGRNGADGSFSPIEHV